MADNTKIPVATTVGDAPNQSETVKAGQDGPEPTTSVPLPATPESNHKKPRPETPSDRRSYTGGTAGEEHRPTDTHTDTDTPPVDSQRGTPAEKNESRNSCSESQDGGHYHDLPALPPPRNSNPEHGAPGDDVFVPVETPEVKGPPSDLPDAAADRKLFCATKSDRKSSQKPGRRSTSRGTKSRGPTSRPVQVEDRDPYKINGELTLRFSEIFAEPETSVHSADCVWKMSERVFSIVKLWCYRVLGVVCAVPCACVWGVTFALLSIASIWVWSPWLKTFRVLMLCVKKMLDYLALAFLVPLFEALSHVFSSIRVNIDTNTAE